MQNPSIKRLSALFLQAVILLIGIGTLIFLLWEPHVEGRNVHASLFEVYFRDPFLAYVYIASIAFFIALYQAFALLGYIGNNKAFSSDSVKALRTIQYCAIVLVAFVMGAVAYLFIVQRTIEEDIAGGVAMCLFAIFISVVIAAAAAVLERLVQSHKD